MTAEAISDGLGKILSDLTGGKSLDQAIRDRTGNVYMSTSDFENNFGDENSALFIHNLTQAVGSNGNGGLATGTLTDYDLLPNASAATSLFTLDTTYDTIKNIYPSDVNVLSGGGKTVGGTAPVPDYPSTIDDDDTGGSTPVTPSAPRGIAIQIGDSANDNIDITIESIKSTDLEINSLSVLTHNDEQKAINLSYNAINKVSQIRSHLGAQQNQLEHAMKYLNNTEENLQYSESRIRDMDMVKGIMEHVKYQILMQSGQAMLTQINHQNLCYSYWYRIIEQETNIKLINVNHTFSG